MRKAALHISILLIINCQLSIINCKAQPNGGFENWHSVFNYQTADDWQTLNFLSIFSPPNPISAFKATGIDKHSGNYALKIKTIFLTNNPIPESLPDTIGNVFTGKINLSPLSIKLGIPYSGRPEKLEFWSKYIPIGEDNAGVFVILQKWNGAGRDTIAFGDKKILSTLSYSFFQIDLIYHSEEAPDTLIIGFASSYHKSKARVGSALYLDDVALTGWVGINEQDLYADKIKIFPNPARDFVNILVEVEEASDIKVIDVSGKLIGNYEIENCSANINTELFAEGIYFFEIRDKKGRNLTKGKFNVIK